MLDLNFLILVLMITNQIYKNTNDLQVVQIYFSGSLNFQIQEFNFKLAYLSECLTKLRDLRCYRNFFERATNMYLIDLIQFGRIMGENWARRKCVTEMTQFSKTTISRGTQLQMVWFLRLWKARRKGYNLCSDYEVQK